MMLSIRWWESWSANQVSQQIATILAFVTHVLIASDAPWVHDDVVSALGRDTTHRSLINGRAVGAAVLEQTPDLVVLDSQISSMGGIAVCHDLRLEESGGRLPHVPVLILLDRQADVFLVKQSKADGWLVKPLDPIRLRKAMASLVAGGRYEDAEAFGDATNNYKPTPDASAR
jgi:DNA-binding response OmpR family regulator